MPRAIEANLLSDADHARSASRQAKSQAPGSAPPLVYSDGFVHQQANEWSQSIFDDLGTGFAYTLLPCCYGLDAITKVDAHLGGVKCCGDINLLGNSSDCCCWCCCGVFMIRAMRKEMRARYQLTGGFCTDFLLGDHCPGCALRQIEAHVDMLNAGGASVVQRIDR